MRALVTGATGFIGRALAEALAQAGWQVTVLVRASSRARLANAERYRVIELDLRDASQSLTDAVADCDVVFHAAAIRDRWGTSRAEYRAVNVEGTRHLLTAALGRVRRFVYISSVGVHGYPGVLGIDETFPLATTHGKVGYHSTKAEAERIVLAAQDHIEAVIIRPTITYGPGDENGMLTRLIDLIARRRFLRISDGHNHVHLTFIDDLTRGLLLAGTHPGAAGKTLILAGPASIAMRDLVQLIEQITAVPVPPFVVPVPLARLLGLILERIYQLGGLTLIPPITRDKVDTLCQHRGFSFAAAERTLGYSPRINYAEGVKRTIEWMIATGHLSL